MKFTQWVNRAALLLVFYSASGFAAEPGVTDTDLKIGQFAAQSGPVSELGKRLKLGILTYFNAVNAEGGVHGRLLHLISRDDHYEPAKSAAVVKQLIEEDQVFALIGSVGTPTTQAALPAINAAGIPLIGPFSGATSLREPLNRNVFHVKASYADEAERIVQHLSTLGIQKIAVFYQNDAYGKDGLDGVMRAMNKRKLTPVASVTVERNSVDVTAPLAELLKANPEAVIQIGTYTTCAALIKEARALSYGGQFFNVSGVGAKALAEELGKAGAGVTVSQVVPLPYAPSSALAREYQQRMSEAGHNELDFSSMEGFIAAKVFTEGLRRAGKNLTRQGLINALESLNGYNLGGFAVSYSAKDHSGSHFTEMTMIGSDGRFIR